VCVISGLVRARVPGRGKQVSCICGRGCDGVGVPRTGRESSFFRVHFTIPHMMYAIWDGVIWDGTTGGIVCFSHSSFGAAGCATY